ncbi:hypothetical protein CEXT_431631 [Caerostris extrusa]|uniref:Uncharacterized protein n=1 Tax=Caerostris extrusa TaxID=172846 RepID=A0AAV4TE95_CAEEX|nr:hypothetical protein CEXT_431631 [Caerostris extrusa]
MKIISLVKNASSMNIIQSRKEDLKRAFADTIGQTLSELYRPLLQVAGPIMCLWHWCFHGVKILRRDQFSWENSGTHPLGVISGLREILE